MLLRAALDVAWRIEELLHLFGAADDVLTSALAIPLTRADLGLPVPGEARTMTGDDDDGPA